MDFVSSISQKAKNNPKHIILPEGNEPRMLHAARCAVDNNLVSRLTILGNIDGVRALAKKENVSLDNIVLKDPVAAEEFENYSNLFHEMRQHKGVTPEQAREAMKNTLPENIRIRKDKIGFQTPEDEWFRSQQYKKFIIDLLNSDNFRNRQLIEPDKAIRLYQEHIRKKRNISKDIWKWICLELWFQKFIDN